jgi:hypothetical protein
MDKRWFVRTGAVMVMFGFVLPAMTISVSAFGIDLLKITYTIYQMISIGKVSLLLLIPIGALITLIFSFIDANQTFKPATLFWCQVGGLALGLLSVIVSVFYLYNKYGKTASNASDAFKDVFKEVFALLQDIVKLNVDYGVYLFGLGFVLMVVGLVVLAPSSLKSAPAVTAGAPPQNLYGSMGAPAYSYPPVSTFTSPPWLEVVSGNFTQTPIQISSNSFMIGRGQNNNLNLPDPTVSHQHAQIYPAQGGWYIQDMGSLGGLFVNDVRIQAKQLLPGDLIRIGMSVFRFMQYQ